MEAHELTSQIVAGVHWVGEPRSLENPNLSLQDPATWEGVWGEYRSDVGISVTADKALMYAPFYRAVQLIAGDVAKLPLNVYKRRPDIGEDARERDRGHRLGYILNVATSDDTEAVKFWTRYVADALIWSNAYAKILFDGSGAPVGLVNLLPDRTGQEIIDGKLWYVTESGGRLIPMYPWEVLHIEGLQVGGAIKVMFQLARNSIGLGLAQEKFASKFFANGGRVGGILEIPASADKAARDKIEEGFRKMYEGSDNPFKTVILRDNAKFHAAQQSPESSQMVEATDSQTRAIAHWFNLPPSKLGLSDSVSYNSKAEDNQNYLDTTLQIWLTRIAAACNFRLISERQSGSHFIEHNTAALLRMNLTAQADAFQKLIASRVMNPNEARAKLNMLPYDGGDEFVNPNTMKSGAPAQEPKDEPTDGQGSPPSAQKGDPKRAKVIAILAVKARDKAKRYKALIDWVDSGFAHERATWRKDHNEQPPEEIMDEVELRLKSILLTAKEPELWLKVDELFKKLEK